jgi:S1-C subfamily serine protease
VRRREFIAHAGAAVVAWPRFTALAQSGDKVDGGGSVVGPPNAPALLKRTSVPFDVKKIEPSVYKIYTMRKKGIGTGTGFLVSGKRTLVTTYHLIANGEKYFVVYRDGSNGKLVEARVVDRRNSIDLAILEAREDLPGRPLTLADFEPEKLTSVVAVGVPAGDMKQDTAPGMVSRIYIANNTALSETQDINARIVEHNAPVTLGGSGGPLVDECGIVIGVNSFSTKGAQGLFFSIHSSEVIRFLRELDISYCKTSTLTCNTH